MDFYNKEACAEVVACPARPLRCVWANTGLPRELYRMGILRLLRLRESYKSNVLWIPSALT